MEIDAITRDQNLMVVVATEGYAQRHGMAECDAVRLFAKHGIPALIRSCYNTLHTQALDESIYFAEDVLQRQPA